MTVIQFGLRQNQYLPVTVILVRNSHRDFRSTTKKETVDPRKSDAT